MADDNDEQEPAVELGDGDTVEGAPLSRVTSRLSWPQERSEIARKEGETVIRTPDGPRELGGVLEEVETAYFERRQEFVRDVENVIGTGPVQTKT